MKPLTEIPEWWDMCVKYRYDIYAFAVEVLDFTPTWQQKQLFDSIAFDGSRTSVASGHGCFGIDTEIMLHDGSIKAVQDVKVGDRLMGDDGTVRNVLELYRGRENMYRFGYADGTFHVFNESHILCLKRDNEYITLKVSEYLNADDNWQWHQYRLINEVCEELPLHTLHELGIGNYYGFELDGNHQFLGGDFTVLHNTGKTSSAGIVALWHLLFFHESIMMFTAPQINQLKKQVWKEISISLERLRQGNYAWLADYVGFQSEMVFIKYAKEKWHIFAKTAPKHQPSNIAGNHGDNYMVWIDEACGVDDAVMDVVLGALTHADNRAVMTSQPARSAGMFFDTHHRLSHRVGGEWTSLVFSGEESPIVSIESIREQMIKYGGRDDPQYQIRVLGKFPEQLGEFLIADRQARQCYEGASIFDSHQYGYVITVDVGGGVGRDDSVIAVSKVWGEQYWGERARRVEVVDIPLCKNTDNIHELYALIHECINLYPNASVVVDDNGAGKGLGQLLKSSGVFYLAVNWGGACFNQDLRREFFNKRAQASVSLARAITQGRFKVKTNKFKAKFIDQITRMPYTFDEQSRFKMLSKEEMKRKGIKSPDLGDAFAFLFLESVHYTEAFEYLESYNDSEEGAALKEKSSRFSALKAAAETLL